jgi:hypothetical protein
MLLADRRPARHPPAATLGRPMVPTAGFPVWVYLRFKLGGKRWLSASKWWNELVLCADCLAAGWFQYSLGRGWVFGQHRWGPDRAANEFAAAVWADAV